MAFDTFAKKIADQAIKRDPRTFFPETRIFVPVWATAGQEPICTKLVPDYTWDSTAVKQFQEGDSRGEFRPNGVYHPAGPADYFDAMNQARLETANYKHLDRVSRRSIVASRRASRASHLLVPPQ